jgi:hypothetical protein
MLQNIKFQLEFTVHCSLLYTAVYCTLQFTVHCSLLYTAVYCTLSKLLTLQFLLGFADTPFIMPFLIRSVVNGMVVGVKDENTNNGAPVILWPYHGGKNQLWEYKNNMIFSKLNGYVSCCNWISLSQSVHSSGVHKYFVHVLLLGCACRFV